MPTFARVENDKRFVMEIFKRIGAHDVTVTAQRVGVDTEDLGVGNRELPLEIGLALVPSRPLTEDEDRLFFTLFGEINEKRLRAQAKNPAEYSGDKLYMCNETLLYLKKSENRFPHGLA